MIVNAARSQNRSKGNDEYYERHHIKPRSLGGENTPENCVLLTFREHFICHRLLCKMTTGSDRRKMQHAVAAMVRRSSEQFRVLTARHFAIAKKHNADAMRGKRFSPERRELQRRNTAASWINADERKLALSERSSRLNRGVPKPASTRQNISKSLQGVKHSVERNLRKSERQKKIWRLTKQSGEVILVVDLPLWCVQNGYNASSISNLASGRIKSYRDLIRAEKLS